MVSILSSIWCRLLLLLLSILKVHGYNICILGGTGRIGTAVAVRLLQKSQDSKITLVGRRKGQDAVQEVLKEHPNSNVEWKQCNNVYEQEQLEPVIENAECVIHVAGPFLNQEPIPLLASLTSPTCRAYVDVSDPLEYLDASLKFNEKTVEAETTALLCAGAFPGMSNVLAMEAASKLDYQVQDMRFNYFTAGLGGSGNVNLYITNLGFGEPMAQFDKGKLKLFSHLSGLLLGQVDFVLNKQNKEIQNRVGRRTVFSWPFPEAVTVARELQIMGDSSAAMGTSPDLWNDVLGILVKLVPRKWWRSPKISQFLADFSQPLVKLTDALQKETHAMRIDVSGETEGISIVQAHDSFRICVGQSCAEFALDVLEHPQEGVWLPEQRYRDDEERQRIIEKLTTTPGTFEYTGPVPITDPPPPSDLDKALKDAMQAEANDTQ